MHVHAYFGAMELNIRLLKSLSMEYLNRTGRGRILYRSRELVPGSWSVVRARRATWRLKTIWREAGLVKI